MIESENIIDILQKAQKAIKNEDIIQIKDLSNRTIHSVSIYQDADNINIAIILYALSKLLERKKYQDFSGWSKFEKAYISSLENALIALRKNDIEAYRDQINRIKDTIKSLSGNLKTYIEEVFRKASINKGSKIYEHGISMEKTAKILGISQWELSQYIGATNQGVADMNLTYTKDIKQRLKDAEEIFK
jgi:hypothetical protein